MTPFCHLHCHTQYSLLDGAARIKKLISRAGELEMPAIAITDHGNLFGVPEFYTAAKREGIRPIIGCEFYVTPSGMQDRNDRTRYHQVLLAKNDIGYRNLIRLSSLSFTDGYYYKPRIDLLALEKYSEGLIATTCCLQGQVNQTILLEGEDKAKEVFKRYLDIFGEDWYVEIQDHNIPDQRRCNEVLLRWAQEFGVAIVATNDVHYVDQQDAAAQDLLLCLQTGRDLNDATRMRFENDQFFMKSSSEMEHALRELNPVDVRRALETSLHIADKCSFELPMGQLLMPHFPLPAEYVDDMDAYLRDLTYERARERYSELSPQITERLDHELGIISEMGYAGYFLIVQDFTTAARELGVSVGPGRGSAAGSLVAYCLGITNIDPLQYGLLFERFLNPERVSMPDIDIDFDDRGRASVIDYVVQKYGRESVCQIITFGTMGARSVIRDVARVLQIPLPEADRIAKMIPEGPRSSLEVAIDEVPEFRKLFSDPPNEQIKALMQHAKVLEGSARHTGVHAAGVIIAPGRVSDYVPVAIAKGKGNAEDVITTQYDGNWVEAFGLLKMDFLGLKTLTVLGDALDLIEANHGVRIDLDTIPLDDSSTFELFQRGDTVAIFQFESSGMREWLRKLRPTAINDLIAMNALYRPGPMDNIPTYISRKHGREKVTFPHKMLEPILEPTYGIPVYQEQVMQMAQVMGGYTLGGADILRRAMGKKKEAAMAEERAKFLEGASGRGVDERTANDVFDLMAKFAGYGFNKSHAAAYSIVAFQTAYLKAHYPAEFMAAAMTNEMSDNKRLAVVMEEARHLGLELLPPSVNGSEARFSVDEGKIRIGLGAVKGVGLGAIEAIIQERDENGPYESLFAFSRRVDLRTVNKKAVDALARAGALDEVGGHRAQLSEAVEMAFQYGQRVQADEAAGMMSLFGEPGGDGAAGMEPDLPTVEPWPKARVLKEEREAVGFYLSGHPLEAFLPESRAFASSQISDAPSIVENESSGDDSFNYHSNRPQHTFCGILTEVQHRTNKTGKPYAFAQFEDFSGQAELVCFSSTYDRVQSYLKVDEIVLIRGSVEMRGGSVKVVAGDVIPMWKVREQLVKSLILRVQTEDLTEQQVLNLESLFASAKGACKLYFELVSREAPAPLRILSRTSVIDPNAEVMQKLTRMFGRRAISVEGES